MSDKKDKPLSLKEFIRREALKKTPPEETLAMVRELVAQDPGLLDFDDGDDVDRPIAEGTSRSEV